MPRYIAFLRAINMGSTHAIKMDLLRRIFESLGFSDVSTFIASGNVIFDTLSKRPELLEQQIEGRLIEALGYEATPFVRTGPEVTRIAGLQAFPISSIHDRDELGVIFLSKPPVAAVRQTLSSARREAEEFRCRGREIHWLRHRAADGAVYSTVLLNKALNQPFTIRSIRTVKKIADKYFAGG